MDIVRRIRKILLLLLSFFLCQGVWGRTEQQKIDTLRSLTTEQLEEKLKLAEGEDKTWTLLVLADKTMEPAPEKSLAYAREALRRAQQSGKPFHIFWSYKAMANYYHVTNQYQEAARYYLEALKLEPHIKDKNWVANALKNIGDTYIDMGQYPKARQYLEMALEKAEKLRNQRLIYYTYNNFIRLYEATGDFSTALELRKKSDQLGDTYFNRENSERIDGLMAQYEAEKTENEIQLLRKTNEIQRIIRVFLVVVVLLGLGVLVVLYSRHRARQKANRLLQQGEARYRTLFDRAGDAVVLMENTTVVDYNDKALEMFGDGLEGLGEVLEGQPPQFHWQHVKKDGTPFDAVVTLAPVTIGQRSLIQCIIHDITQRKRLEEECVKSARLETITLVAGGIGHDFNNLLAIILGNVELALSETEPGTKTFSLLSQLEKSVRSAVELVGKFRSIAEGGMLPKEIQPIGDILREAVHSVLEKAAPAEPGVECRFDIPADVAPVPCFWAQIRRAFENLADNALEAVADNGKIEISAANLELTVDEVPPLPAGRYVNIFFADNGEGIPPENLTKIFEPYFTTHSDITRKGLGMGLTAAEAIIKRHDGAIKVSSEIGKGTTFSIYLPTAS